MYLVEVRKSYIDFVFKFDDGQKALEWLDAAYDNYVQDEESFSIMLTREAE